MYTWSVGSGPAPFEFSGHCCGAANSRSMALKQILANAEGHFVLGPRGFANIQRDVGKGLTGNPVEDVVGTVCRYLRKKGLA